MLALLLILLPVLLHLVLLLCPRLRGRQGRPQRAYVLATLLGLLTPWAARLVMHQESMGNPPQVACGLMATSFLLLGLLITATVLPTVAVLSWAGSKRLAA